MLDPLRVRPNELLLECPPDLRREIKLGADFFFGSVWGVKGFGSGSGGGSKLFKKSIRLSSFLGLSLGCGKISKSSSSSLRSMAYGSRTRRCLRFGAISPSSKLFAYVAGLLALLKRALCEFIDEG